MTARDKKGPLYPLYIYKLQGSESIGLGVFKRLKQASGPRTLTRAGFLLVGAATPLVAIEAVAPTIVGQNLDEGGAKVGCFKTKFCKALIYQDETKSTIAK